MNIRRIFVIASLLLTISVTGLYAEHLVIMSTNDTHSQIDPDFDGKGGILRRKVLIDSVRAAEKNFLLVDAGDDVQGTLYFSLFKGKVEYPMLDSLGYDISIMGNHEFDNGIDSLAQYYKLLKVIHLSSNYDLSNTPLAGMFKPYVIKEFDGKKIGFIGINLNPQGMITANTCRGLVYKDATTVANETAAYLKNEQKVDYVVMISHIGYTKENENTPGDVDIVKSSTDIDLVIGGHSHTLINPADANSKPYRVKNKNGRDVIITQLGRSGKYIGYINIDLDDLASIVYRPMPVSKKYDSRINYPTLQGMITPYKKEVDAMMNKTIAQSARALPKDGAAMQNWVADMAKTMATAQSGMKIDMAIMNKGGIRQPMPAGDVSEGLVKSMFPFSNNIFVLQISGADLLESFAVMAKRGGDAVSRECKVLYTKGGKIKKATINGKKINPKKIYTIATLDYLANGGDYMVPLTRAKAVFKDDIMYGSRMLDMIREDGKAGKQINPSDETRMYRAD